MPINLEFEVLALLNPAKMCDIDSTKSLKSYNLHPLHPHPPVHPGGAKIFRHALNYLFKSPAKVY